MARGRRTRTTIPEARFNLGVALEAQGKLGEARAEYERARRGEAVAAPGGGEPRACCSRSRATRAAPRPRTRASCATSPRTRSRASGSPRSTARPASTTSRGGSRARRCCATRRSVGAHKVLAQVALARNELDLAKLIALRAQKLDPKDPELPCIAGQVLARQGDDAGATAQFRRRSRSQPELPARAVRPPRGCREEGGVGRRSPSTRRPSSRSGAQDAAVHLALGIAQRHLGKPDEALASYARAEKLAEGRFPEVHLARGVLLMRVKNECEPALASFRAYARAAGPVAAAESQAPKLAARVPAHPRGEPQAAEAAKQMQAEAERKAAEEAARRRAGQPDAKPAAPAPHGSARPHRRRARRGEGRRSLWPLGEGGKLAKQNGSDDA